MSYKFDSFVNRSEANALKEMIFNRVKARNEADSQDEQNEVMDLARKSFVSKNNPFSQIIEQANQKTTPQPANSLQNSSENKHDETIGFPQRELKSRAIEQERIVNEQTVVREIQNNMIEARNSLSNKKSFVGALNFINSQAAVSLMRTRSDKFEVVV